METGLCKLTDDSEILCLPGYNPADRCFYELMDPQPPSGPGHMGQGAVAGGAGAGAGPALQQVLEDVQDLVEGQVGVGAFGASRLRVRNAWTAVTWWCQPRQVRPSKWPRPRPCLSSR